MNILYNIALFILAIISFPKMFYYRLRGIKYKVSLKKRFGRDFPVINKGSRPLIWIHAVSMGETKAVGALAKKLKADHNPLLLVSSITESGHEEAKRSMPFADAHVFLPFDLPWIIHPIIDQIKPDLVVLTETDFWFNFLKRCKENGAKIALVNGKLSQRSASRFQKFPTFSHFLFNLIDAFCVQNELYRSRFAKTGIPLGKIFITGNLKFDIFSKKLTPAEVQAKKELFGIKSGEKVIVFGSTHEPEERMFLNIIKTIPNIKVILVPRHPERFKEVEELIKDQNISFIRYSELNKREGDEKVILVDAMGLLKECYQIADLAVVGGSFTSKVGGHNIIEPCEFGKPVFFGPFMHTQIELVELVKEFKAGLQLSENQLKNALTVYLNDDKKRAELGQNGLRLIEKMQGATERTFQIVKSLID